VGWDLRVFAANKGGHCPNVVAHGYFFSAMFSITDVVLLLLPIFAVSKLQLKPMSKFGVMFLFSLGALSCIFCIWKSFYLRSVVHSTDVSCKCYPPLFQQTTNAPSIPNLIDHFRGAWSCPHSCRPRNQHRYHCDKPPSLDFLVPPYHQHHPHF
jgi:hypothetical protein